MSELREQAKALEEEVVALRRRLQDAPKRVRTLEERLLETKGQLAQAVAQNEKLTYTLREAREHIAALREEVDKLTQPPSAYGTLLGRSNDDGTVDVFSGGRKMRVAVHPDLDADDARAGRRGRAQRVAQRRARPRRASATARSSRSRRSSRTARRALIVGRADEERVAELADELLGEQLRVGRHGAAWTPARACCSRSCPGPRSRSWCSKRCPTSPTTTSAASTTRSSRSPTRSSCRSCTSELFAEHKLPAPKGILLYGPPGLRQDAHRQGGGQLPGQEGRPRSAATPRPSSYFLNIKGPELLNKYVGETERQIRLVFQRAREKSEEGWPVIVFFDEMDSLFRTRGTGISSDIESTIVPQLLAEIDGVESLKNVIVIGASNREDLIDPAILRPGRLDVKIKIERPDEGAAAQIFARYLTADLPLDADEVADARRRRRRQVRRRP